VSRIAGLFAMLGDLGPGSGARSGRSRRAWQAQLARSLVTLTPGAVSLARLVEQAHDFARRRHGVVDDRLALGLLYSLQSHPLRRECSRAWKGDIPASPARRPERVVVLLPQAGVKLGVHVP
jgi:hypothetical protein